jgi:hypothetical protein
MIFETNRPSYNWTFQELIILPNDVVVLLYRRPMSDSGGSYQYRIYDTKKFLCKIYQRTPVDRCEHIMTGNSVICITHRQQKVRIEMLYESSSGKYQFLPVITLVDVTNVSVKSSCWYLYVTYEQPKENVQVLKMWHQHATSKKLTFIDDAIVVSKPTSFHLFDCHYDEVYMKVGPRLTVHDNLLSAREWKWNLHRHLAKIYGWRNSTQLFWILDKHAGIPVDAILIIFDLLFSIDVLTPFYESNRC